MIKKIISLLTVVVLVAAMFLMSASAAIPTGITEQPTNTMKTNGNGGKTDVGAWMVMYKSSYEPWAVALTGTRGKDPGYDPLEYAIQEAHNRP